MLPTKKPILLFCLISTLWLFGPFSFLNPKVFAARPMESSRLWSWPAVTYYRSNEQSNKKIKIKFSDASLLEELHFDPTASGNFDDSNPLINNFHAVIKIADATPMDVSDVALSHGYHGYDIFKDHFKRKFLLSKFSPNGVGSKIFITNYGELIDRSEIFYLWPRISFLNNVNDPTLIDYSFDLSGSFDQVYYFEKVGNSFRIKNQSLGSTEFLVPVSHQKPYIVLYNSHSGTGLTFLLPLSQPELRSWDADDYVVSDLLDLTVSISKQKQITKLSYLINSNKAIRKNDTVDLYFTLRPFSGSPISGFTFFNPDGSTPSGITSIEGPLSGDNSKLRYYPIEGYSTNLPKEGSWGFTTVRKEAFHWGNVSGTFHSWGRYKIIPNFLKFENQVWQDEAERLLEVYLDKSKDNNPSAGSPPHKLLAQRLLNKITNTGDTYKHFHFSLSTDFATRLAADLFPYFSQNDREKIFNDLNSLQELYKEDGLYTWAKRINTGNGYALWFNYSSHKVWSQYPPDRDVSVMNTHVGAVKTAAQMMFLAQALNREADILFWKNMTEKGIDGIIWYMEQPDAWSEEDGVLNYNLGGHKSISYENMVAGDLSYISRLSSHRINDLVPGVTRLFENTLARGNFTAPINFAHVYGDDLSYEDIRSTAMSSPGGIGTILPLHPAPLFKFSFNGNKPPFWQIDDSVFTFKKNTGNEYSKELSISVDEKAAQFRGETATINYIKAHFSNKKFFPSEGKFQLTIPTEPFEICQLFLRGSNSASTSNPTSSVCPKEKLGNLNCDTEGRIDEVDLNIFLSLLIPNGPAPSPELNHRADLNNDDRVDETDLNVLLVNWQI